MARSRKDIRELSGYTFKSNLEDSEIWLHTAKEFNKAAILLHGGAYNPESFAYYLNAGTSLELIFKAIIVSENPSKLKTTHNLKDLCNISQVSLTNDQIFTLELLTEHIIWYGKYPTPKTEEFWHKYHDEIRESHILRQLDGTTSKVLANQKRFPTLENYKAIWEACKIAYNSIN